MVGGVTRLVRSLAPFLVLTALLAACGSAAGDGSGNGLPAGGAPTQSADGKITVVAAENVWGDIASQIGGDRVAVTSIISDPNADPHQYESNVDNAAAIAHADVVIVNGLGYDDFMNRLLSASSHPGRDVLQVSKIVGVRGSNPNPHLWYDPAYVDRTARAIETALIQREPRARAAFEDNLHRFLGGEARVSTVIEEIKVKYAGTAIAYTERVPGYLVEAAGLRLGTPASFSQSIEDGTDPSPLDNAEFEKAITSHAVEVLLYNAQVVDSETDHIKSRAKSSHVPIVGVTETLPKGKNFQTWQRDQAEALLAALGG